MPLHLNSITNNLDNPNLINAIHSYVAEDYDKIALSEDKLYIQITKFLHNINDGELIGKIVFTVFVNQKEKKLQTIDIDIVLSNKNSINLDFIQRLPCSSDANEYYNVNIVDTQQILQIETVNRHLIASDILNTTQKVYVSAFPFKLNIFNDIYELNSYFGYSEKTKIKGTEFDGFTIELSDTFTAPSDMFKGDEHRDETFSFLIGTVHSFEDVSIKLKDIIIDLTIAQVKTALGIIPVALSREAFNLENLQIGKVVSMKADIKVDFEK